MQSYDPTSGVRVRVLGAQAGLIGPLPVSQSIGPALLVVGARCLVAMLNETNPADGAVLGAFGGPPAPWVQAGSASLLLVGVQLSGSVGFPLPFAAVLGVAATSRDAGFVASVSGEYGGGFLLTVTRREGALQLQAGVATISVAVYWQATGDPAVNQTVLVDWPAVGT